ncbi:MAG: type II toxin-antitoxin system HicB family antitoxin [Lautropia sp.]|nr:type II toxin-antitoxin system HicB family antitoxin [Lautropia sp.]
MTAYAIVVEQRGNCFRAYVPDFPGCTATGNSLAEAEAGVRDALRLLTGPGAVRGSIPVPLEHGGYHQVLPARGLAT